MTVNDIIKSLTQRTPDMDSPGVLSEYLVQLSAMIWEAGNKIIEAEVAYNKKWNEIRPTYKTDKQTDMFMKSQPEYVVMEQAKLAQRTLIETIRSLKRRITVLSEEAHSTVF